MVLILNLTDICIDDPKVRVRATCELDEGTLVPIEFNSEYKLSQDSLGRLHKTKVAKFEQKILQNRMKRFIVDHIDSIHRLLYEPPDGIMVKHYWSLTQNLMEKN